MRKKGIAIATAINAALYFSLPSDMGRFDVLLIMAAVYAAAWVISLPINDLHQKRQETNTKFTQMRNEKPAPLMAGSNGWEMVEISPEEAKQAG